jgi:dipeptidyl aminopeptidase/acylaminoacyl peptidase
VIPTDGGEARRITSMPISASSPKFTPDGRRIVFVSAILDGFESLEATKKELETREKSKAKVRVTENRIYRYWDAWLTDGEQMRLFAVDLEGGKPVDLLPGWKGLFDLIDSGQTIDFDISPDGASVAFAANVVPAPYRTSNKDLFVMPLAGGTPRNLTKDNPAEDSSPRWSPNGKTLAFGRETKGDGYPDRTRLALLDVASGKVDVLTEAWDNVPSGWQFTADGKTLVFKAEVRARAGLYTLPVSGGTPKQLLRGGTVGGMEVSSKDEVLFSLSTFDTAPEIHSLPLTGGTPKPVSQVNDALMAKFAFGKVEDVTFKGADGDDVQMFILYPPDFTPTKKWPLVHMIHGGPVGTFGDGWSYRWNPQLFAAPGYVVALVNFHGSSSFGQKWVESILGAHPDKPFTDIMKATDFLLAKGFIDEKRMAAAKAAPTAASS